MDTIGKSRWGWFPWALGGSMAVVFAVNADLVWMASKTFPGAVDDHAFDVGNNYNAILDNVARQAALGWTLAAEIDADRRVAITLTGRDGAPLDGAELTVIAFRPVGPEQKTILDLIREGGRFHAANALPAPGQWEVELIARRDGQEYRASRRLVAP